MASADIFPVTGRNADAADVIKGALDATEKVIEMLIKGIIEHETRLRAIEVRLAIQPQSEPETPN